MLFRFVNMDPKVGRCGSSLDESNLGLGDEQDEARVVQATVLRLSDSALICALDKS